MPSIKKERKTPCYSEQLIELAYQHLFIENDIFTEKSPGLTPLEITNVKSFDDYMRQIMKKMFCTVRDPKTGTVLGQLPDNYFDNYVFHVCSDDTPNAYTFPGGISPDNKVHICISSGLIDIAENEDEIIGVVGHEVGHTLFNFFKASNKNTPVQESLCDFFPLIHMQNAGYNPDHFVAVMKRLLEKNPYRTLCDKIRALADVHPLDTTRIEEMEAVLTNLYQNNLLKETPTRSLNKNIFPAIKALTPVAQRKENIFNTHEIQTLNAREILNRINAYLQQNCLTLYAKPTSSRDARFSSHTPNIGYFNADTPWHQILCDRYLSHPQFEASLTPPDTEPTGSMWKNTYYNPDTQLWSDEIPACYPEHIASEHKNIYTWQILPKHNIGTVGHACCTLVQKIYDECGSLDNLANIVKMAGWLKPLFEEIKNETPTDFYNLTDSQIHHPAKIKAALFFHLLETVSQTNEARKFNNQSAIDLDTYLPDDIKEIKQLYDLALNGQREIFTQACTQLKERKPFLEILCALSQSENNGYCKNTFPTGMQQIAYRNRYRESDNAEFLFHIMRPEITQPVVGEPMPYLDLIQQAKNHIKHGKIYSDESLILRAMGIYDIQANEPTNFYPGKSLRAGQQRSSFDEYKIAELKYKGTNVHLFDVENFASYYIAYFERPDGIIEYRYDKTTGIVTTVIQHQTNAIEPKKHFQKMIESYAKDVYDQKVLKLNQIHYQLKEDLKTLDNKSVSDEEFFNAVVRLTATAPSAIKGNKILRMVLLLDVTDNQGVNSALHTVYLSSKRERIPCFNLGELKTPDEAIRLQYEKKYPQDPSDADERLFSFLEQENISNKITEAWLDLLNRGLTNPTLSQKLSELNAPWLLDFFHHSLPDFKSKYFDKYLEILSQEPYLNATFDNYGTILPQAQQLAEQLIEKSDLMYIRQKYPALYRKIFSDYTPVTSIETLNMAQHVSEHSRYIYKDTWSGNQYFYRGPSSNNITIYDVQQVEIAYWLTNGGSGVPAAMLLTHSELYKDNPNGEVAQQYCRHLQDRNNWPHSTFAAVSTFAYALELEKAYSQKAEETSVLFACIPNLLQEYKTAIFHASEKNKKRDLLALLWNPSTTPFIPRHISHEFLDMHENQPSIWTGSVKDQVELYNWLVYQNAFGADILFKRKILTQLIEKIKSLSASEREELSFALLGNRSTAAPRNINRLKDKDISSLLRERPLYTVSGVEFPSLEESLRNIWVDAVAEIMGGPDDSSDTYMKRMQPYIQKIHSTQKCISVRQKKKKISNNRTVFVKRFEYHFDVPYTELSAVLKSRLSAQLQDKLISQAKLSEILDCPIDTAGKLDDDNVNNAIGYGTDFFIFLINDPKMAEDTIDYLLGEATPENTQNYVQAIQNNLSWRIHSVHSINIKPKNIEKWIDIKNTQNLENIATLWYDQFWDKSLDIRAGLLKSLYKFQYPNSSTEMIVSQMTKRLFAKTGENPFHETIYPFYQFLTTFALAVPKQKKDYLPLMLLAGCLSAKKEVAGEKFNLPEACRIFLEAQGAGGIKLGQMLSKQQEIPKEYQDEFIKLTNHADAPSRAEVFRLLDQCFSNAAEIIRQRGGLGKLIGAASHFMTFPINQNEDNGIPLVLSLSKNYSNLTAEKFYNRIQKTLDKLLKMYAGTKTEEMLLIISDAVKHVNRMNNIELDGNMTLKQYFWFKQAYDGVIAKTNYAEIEFKVVPFVIDEKESYCSKNLKNGGMNAYKFMELANGIDYTLLAKNNQTPTELAELEKAGIPTDMEQQIALKKSLATANCFVQMRAILTGDRFDDDRHQGQIKIERKADKNGKPNYYVHMFDVGSTSLEKPSQIDLQILGRILYKTIVGMNILTSDKTFADKRTNLQEIFSDTYDILKLISKTTSSPEEKSVSDSSNLFISLFNKALKEVKNTEIVQTNYNRETPPYIAKIERALINLTHFFHDISETDMKSIALSIVNNKDIIHPEIIAGMETEATPIIAHMFKNVIQNVDVAEFISTKSNPQELTTSIVNMMALPHLTAKEAEIVYSSFAQLYYHQTIDMNSLQEWVKTLPSDKIRKEITDNVISVLLTTVQILNGESETKAQSDKITAGILTALHEKGLPPALLDALRRESLKIKPLSRKLKEMLKLTIAFPAGKLTFPIKKRAQSVIRDKISSLMTFTPQLREFQQDLKKWLDNLSIQYKTTESINTDLPDREWKLEDPFHLRGDATLIMFSDALSSKKDVHRQRNMARQPGKETVPGIQANIRRQQIKVEKYLKNRKVLLKKIDYLKKQAESATTEEKAAIAITLQQYEKQCAVLTAEYNRDIRILEYINIEAAAEQQSHLINQRALAMQDTPQARINSYLQKKDEQQRKTDLIQKIQTSTVLTNSLGNIGKAFKQVIPHYLDMDNNPITLQELCSNPWCLRIVGYMNCISKNNDLTPYETVQLVFSHLTETAEIIPFENQTDEDIKNVKKKAIADLLGTQVDKMDNLWIKLQQEGLKYLMDKNKKDKNVLPKPADKSR